MDEARSADWHTAAPLIVLSRARVPQSEQPPNWTADREEPLIASWQPYQRSLAARSPRGRFQIAEESGHYIQNHQPDLVVAAIHEVVEVVRQESLGR